MWGSFDPKWGRKNKNDHIYELTTPEAVAHVPSVVIHPIIVTEPHSIRTVHNASSSSPSHSPRVAIAMQHFLMTWGYLAIFLLTVLESACIPIPSEVTLGLSGALASGALIGGAHGHLNIGLVIAFGTLGSVAGSLLAYAVGRTGGRALVDRYGTFVLLSHADLDKTEAWFSRRGEWMVLYGRVVPVIRTFISLPAGMAEMKIPKFIGLTAIGVSLWVSLLSGLGYALGSSWDKMVKALGYVGYGVAALIVLLVIGFLIRRHRSVSMEVSMTASEPAPSPTEQQMVAKESDAPEAG